MLLAPPSMMASSHRVSNILLPYSLSESQQCSYSVPQSSRVAAPHSEETAGLCSQPTGEIAQHKLPSLPEALFSLRSVAGPSAPSRSSLHTSLLSPHTWCWRSSGATSLPLHNRWLTRMFRLSVQDSMAHLTTRYPTPQANKPQALMPPNHSLWTSSLRRANFQKTWTRSWKGYWSYVRLHFYSWNSEFLFAREAF